MKLSSISLIAVALRVATTAGSAIAVPLPLYTRALERVNSFQRDLDVHRRESGVVVLPERDVDGEPVDNLVTRTRGVTNAEAARYIWGSASVLRQAAVLAHKASKKVGPGVHSNKTNKQWEEKNQEFTQDATELWDKHLKYSLAKSKNQRPKQQEAMENDMIHAAEKSAEAQDIACEALEDIRCHKSK